MKPLRVLDLFSGIGGFSLGLERTGGFQTVAFCEIEPYCQKVLAKHWPDVRCYDDVRTLSADALRRDGIAVDVICGGFPCQDISFAGKGAGIDGERSGLWGEFVRLIGEIRPRYVIVENVSALLHRGLDRVLGDLAEIGYDAEWHCIPAAAVGAPHQRDRIWIIAFPNGDGEHDGTVHAEMGGAQKSVSDANFEGLEGWDGRGVPQCAREWTARTSSPSLADAEGCGRAEGDPDGRGSGEGSGAAQWAGSAGSGWWLAEPDVGRVAHGVPSRMDRLKGLGNAVVPQIPELIGRAILVREAAG